MNDFSNIDEQYTNYYRNTLVRTVGELKQIIRDLPDDFPLVSESPATSSLLNNNLPTNFNGMKAITGKHCFIGENQPRPYPERWCLRFTEINEHDWLKIMGCISEDKKIEIIKSFVEEFEYCSEEKLKKYIEKYGLLNLAKILHKYLENYFNAEISGWRIWLDQDVDGNMTYLSLTTPYGIDFEGYDNNIESCSQILETIINDNHEKEWC